jgi:hypothetical protein
MIMAEVFSGQQPSGNGETQTIQVSMFQALITEGEYVIQHKENMLKILDQLKTWLGATLEKDIGFNMRLVKAVEDNAPKYIDALPEDNIPKIAEKYAYRANGGDNGEAANS